MSPYVSPRVPCKKIRFFLWDTPRGVSRTYFAVSPACPCPRRVRYAYGGCLAVSVLPRPPPMDFSPILSASFPLASRPSLPTSNPPELQSPALSPVTLMSIAKTWSYSILIELINFYRFEIGFVFYLPFVSDPFSS